MNDEGGLPIWPLKQGGFHEKGGCDYKGGTMVDNLNDISAF